MSSFPARIIQGKLHINSPDRFKQHLAKFTPEDLLIVSVEKPKKIRSNQQNRYYWSGVLGTITLDTGHTENELHEVFKRMFLPKRYITLGGKEVELMGTTTALTTQEFAKYIDQIIIYASSELSIAIPSPEEYLNGI